MFSTIVIVLTTFSVSMVQGSCYVNSLQNFHCYCNNRLNGDANAGWGMTCFDKNTEEEIFVVDYSINTKVSIRCYRHISYEDILFEKYGFVQIKHFQFINCSVPNIPFSSLLKPFEVKFLEFVDQKDLKEVDRDLFVNFSSLQSLSLNNNGIQTLPTNVFANLPHLNVLQLNHNNISALYDNTFASLRNLSMLTLIGNNLSEVPSNVFSNLCSLKELYLNINKLTELPANIFENLTQLRTLDLSQNKFSQLSSEIFNNLREINKINLAANEFELLPLNLFTKSNKVEELDISFNPNIRLSDDVFYGLESLKTLKMHNCDLTSIEENIFLHTPKLETVQMWNNRLRTLPGNLFSNNINLKSLYINFNDLESLPENIFKKQYKLLTLNLCNNNLKALSKGIFENLTALTELKLCSNFLLTVQKSYFKNLQKLEYLDLSHNKISFLDDNPFGLSRNLKMIDLSFNSITKVPYINWSIHLGLDTVNFKHNQIYTFAIPIIYSNSAKVYLQNNKIQTVMVKNIKINDDISFRNNYSAASDLPQFYLLNNPLKCDCNLYDFVNYVKDANIFKYSAVFPDAKDLICHRPFDLSKKNMVSIANDKFICKIIKNCPSFCSCYVVQQDLSTTVNCRSQRLTTLPDVLPFNTSTVLLDNNEISSLNFSNTQWMQITNLQISNNSISTIKNVKIPRNLKILNLQDNNLQTLTNNLMNHTTTTNDFQLNLGNNPWKCDCSTLEFKSWLAENFQKIKDIDNIFCDSSNQSNNVSIIKMPDNKLCNFLQQRQEIILIVCVCFFPALLLFVISVFYYRNKQIIIAYVYINCNVIFKCFFNEGELDEDKIYDAFVSYSSADRDVAMQLVEELENAEPFFKLCIHERDWLAGNYISHNIINSVQNSRKTILILSTEFLKSMWFRVEFHTAYHQMLEDKIDRLIIIIRGEVSFDENLDKDLKFLLSTKTYLKWGERWFWEKLRYTMPHKRKSTTQSVNCSLHTRPKSKSFKLTETKIGIINNISSTYDSSEVQDNNTLIESELITLAPIHEMTDSGIVIDISS